jgi:hypothetical protein
MSETEIEHWRKNFAEAGSPKQLQGVIRDLADDLIGARVSSIKASYRMAMRQEPPEFLSPEAKGALEKIKARNPSKAEAKPAATSAAPAPKPGASALPAAAQSKLQEGHITTFGNGQKWTLHNGQPEQVQ